MRLLPCLILVAILVSPVPMCAGIIYSAGPAGNTSSDPILFESDEVVNPGGFLAEGFVRTEFEAHQRGLRAFAHVKNANFLSNWDSEINVNDIIVTGVTGRPQ